MTHAQIAAFLNAEADPHRNYVIGDSPGAGLHVGDAHHPGVWPDNLLHGETIVSPRRSDGKPWSAYYVRRELQSARRAA